MSVKPKLLVVDDDENNVEFLRDSLYPFFDVKVSYKGLEALSVLEKFTDIDIILIDIHMPNFSGYKVAQKILENEKTKQIPFVFLTADDSNEAIEKGFELGALDYLIKPLDKRVIKQKIKVYLKYINKK